MKQFLQRILQEIMEKKIFGTSNTWSMSHSSQQPSLQAYYIEDCRISGRCCQMLLIKSTIRNELVPWNFQRNISKKIDIEL